MGADVGEGLGAEVLEAVGQLGEEVGGVADARPVAVVAGAAAEAGKCAGGVDEGAFEDFGRGHLERAVGDVGAGAGDVGRDVFEDDGLPDAGSGAEREELAGVEAAGELVERGHGADMAAGSPFCAPSMTVSSAVATPTCRSGVEISSARRRTSATRSSGRVSRSVSARWRRPRPWTWRRTDASRTCAA